MSTRIGLVGLALTVLAGCSSSAAESLQCADGTAMVADGSAASGHWYAWHHDRSLFLMDLRDDSCRELADAPAPEERNIAIHEGGIFYASESSKLVRHDIGTGEATALHETSENLGNPWDYAFSATHVYVATYGAIVRAPIEGGTFEHLLDLSASVGVTVGEDGRVFAANWSAEIWDLSDPDSPTMLADQSWAMQSMSQVGDSLYVNTWSAPTKVLRLSTTDGSEVEIGQATTARAHVADETGIYMASLGGRNGYPRVLTHMSFSGETTRLGTFPSNMEPAATISLSDDYVFWHVEGGPVRRAPKP